MELGRLDLQLGDLIDCCSFRGRVEYQASNSLPQFSRRSYAVRSTFQGLRPIVCFHRRLHFLTHLCTGYYASTQTSPNVTISETVLRQEIPYNLRSFRLCTIQLSVCPPNHLPPNCQYCSSPALSAGSRCQRQHLGLRIPSWAVRVGPALVVGQG